MEKKVFTSTVPVHDVSVLDGKEVILDASAVMKFQGFDNFMKSYYPILTKDQKVLLFPNGGRKELADKAKNEPEFYQKVKNTAVSLEYLLKQKKLCYIGSEQGTEKSEETILRYVVNHRGKKSLAVLTQNGKLASDILLVINKLRSWKGIPVDVYRINPDGDLGEFDFSGNFRGTSVRDQEEFIPEFAAEAEAEKKYESILERLKG